VDRLALRGGERVLEVGCGPGAAAELVCAQLTDGHLSAVDRSPVMVERTAARNADAVAAARLCVQVLDLAALAPETVEGPFDVAFAVDVNVVAGPGAGELHRLSTVLVPGGVLHLVHRPPDPAKVAGFEHDLREALPRAGFVVDDVTVAELGEGRILGVRAVWP